MKINKKGFTLIELLVVVLIIGILAAVALPQYRRAVEKSKAAEALTILKSASQSVELYYMLHNDYPKNATDFGFEFPSLTGNTQFIPNSISFSNKDWSLSIESNSSYFGLIMGRIKGKYKGAYFSSYFKYPNQIPPRSIQCRERKTSYNYIFDTNLPEGSYCEKIIGATYVEETDYSRIYHLPA